MSHESPMSPDNDPETPTRTHGRHIALYAVLCIVAVVSAHLVGYLTYDSVRGFGNKESLAERWVMLLAVSGLVVHSFLGYNPERPRFETRKAILSAEVAIVGCCWVFVWTSNWTAEAVRSYMFGAASAAFVALTVLVGIATMNMRVAAETNKPS